jgi:ADP-L-glycero-D-manno-heptose 6-epimerase
MKILITGYKGFIGQNLYKFLSNDYTVIGYDYDPYQLPNIENVDFVIHLGAISSTTETDVEKVLNQNLDFSIRLLDECEKYQIPFQYASSASVYGNTTNFSEHSPVSPKSPYAWSKYLFDRHISKNNYKTLVQGFRYFNVYGIGEDHKLNQASPVTTFKNQAITTGKITLFENSDQYLRDFVHVNDVCKVHSEFIKKVHFTSGVWNVGTGNAVSFYDIAHTIAKKYSAKIEIMPMPENIKSHYQSYTCANNEKLNNYVNIDWTNVLDWINNEH